MLTGPTDIVSRTWILINWSQRKEPMRNLSDDNCDDVQREVYGDDQEGEIGHSNPCGQQSSIVGLIGQNVEDQKIMFHLSGSRAAAGRRAECVPGSPWHTCSGHHGYYQVHAQCSYILALTWHTPWSRSWLTWRVRQTNSTNQLLRFLIFTFRITVVLKLQPAIMIWSQQVLNIQFQAMMMPRLTEGILLSHPELVGEGENNSNVAIKNPAADYFDRRLSFSRVDYFDWILSYLRHKVTWWTRWWGWGRARSRPWSGPEST